MIGKLVHDYALGKNGIVVSGAWTMPADENTDTPAIPWEWCVLYEDGELFGASTNDLQVIE